jgi:hypothetical protein
MTARKIRHSKVSRFEQLPEAKQRALREMSFEEIANQTFKEIWGQDLEEVLRNEEAKKKLPQKA